MGFRYRLDAGKQVFRRVVARENRDEIFSAGSTVKMRGLISTSSGDSSDESLFGFLPFHDLSDKTGELASIHWLQGHSVDTVLF